MVSSVLVVGAGIAGMATSNRLAQAGVDVLLVERNENLVPRGLGLALQPNALAALGRLGLDEPVRSAAVPYDRAVRAMADGTPFLELPFPPDAGGRPTMYGAHRNTLIEALATGLEAEVRVGTSIESLEQHDRGVDVGLSDGTSRRFDAVIGADGIDSVTRTLIVERAAVVRRDYVAWRALVKLTDGDPHQTILRGGDEAFFGSFPVTAEDLYFFALQYAPRELETDPTIAGLVELSGRFEEYCQALVGRVREDDLIFVPVREVMLDRWVEGRVALIGDAAHAIVPYLAQGAAMALEDAASLCEALLSQDDASAALRAWEARRAPRVEMVRQVCRVNGISASLEGRDAAESLDSDEKLKAAQAVAGIYA